MRKTADERRLVGEIGGAQFHRRGGEEEDEDESNRRSDGRIRGE